MVIGFWKTNEEYGFLSNWYIEGIKLDSYEYLCVEQYMMYHKALIFGDDEIGKKILRSTSPSQMKLFGRWVKNFSPEVWDARKEEIVYTAVKAKFTQHADLQKKLLDTGNNILAEASPKDTIWGIGMPAGPEIQNPENWHGENLLGKILMRVRDEIREEQNNAVSK